MKIKLLKERGRKEKKEKKKREKKGLNSNWSPRASPQAAKINFSTVLEKVQSVSA